MSIDWKVLGDAGRDNALLVRLDGGQSVSRFLFDCGDGCLTGPAFSEVQSIDHLFFSHLHMDHVGGFDTFFRCNFGRAAPPNEVWGPPETARILQHRFRGFMWNLNDAMDASWRVHEVFPDRVASARFELREAFEVRHDGGARPRDGALLDTPLYSVEAVQMDHLTPSLAYVVREKERRNIDPARLAAIGLRPGPWLRQLKEETAIPGAVVEVGGKAYAVAALRDALTTTTAGDSVAYLTDFLLDDAATDRLVPLLSGCKVIVCESQYSAADQELAALNRHMTSRAAAELARRAGAGELVLFHLSDRYTGEGWRGLLGDARAVFANTTFPGHWGVAAP